MPEEGAELLYVQSCAAAWLRQRGFTLILEHEDHEDGWRGEFIGTLEEEEVVLLCHKPARGPYLTLCLMVTTGEPAGLAHVLQLMDCAGDFDAAAWYGSEDGGRIHLCSRLLLSGMNPEDFDFTLNNLLYCRKAVMALNAGDSTS